MKWWKESPGDNQPDELVLYYAFYLQVVTTERLFQRKNKELSQKNPQVGLM